MNAVDGPQRWALLTLGRVVTLANPGSAQNHVPMLESLASYRHCVDRLSANWPGFLEKRHARLAEQERHGIAAEKVAENILEDLFTGALDWGLSELDHRTEDRSIARPSGSPPAWTWRQPIGSLRACRERTPR